MTIANYFLEVVTTGLELRIVFCWAYWLILSLLGFHRQSFESVINDQLVKDRDEIETGKVCVSILHYFEFILLNTPTSVCWKTTNIYRAFEFIASRLDQKLASEIMDDASI